MIIAAIFSAELLGATWTFEPKKRLKIIKFYFIQAFLFSRQLFAALFLVYKELTNILELGFTESAFHVVEKSQVKLVSFSELER